MAFEVPNPWAMPTLIMVRTKCCEGYKQFGQRCSICPNRPENRQAVVDYLRNSQVGLGCRGGCGEGCCGKHPSAIAEAAGAMGD